MGGMTRGGWVEGEEGSGESGLDLRGHLTEYICVLLGVVGVGLVWVLVGAYLVRVDQHRAVGLVPRGREQGDHKKEEAPQQSGPAHGTWLEANWAQLAEVTALTSCHHRFLSPFLAPFLINLPPLYHPYVGRHGPGSLLRAPAHPLPTRPRPPLFWSARREKNDWSWYVILSPPLSPMTPLR